MTDSQHEDLTLNTDASGRLPLRRGGPRAPAELKVEADGYLVLVVPRGREERVRKRRRPGSRPKPKQPKVLVTAKEITIKEQIQIRP